MTQYTKFTPTPNGLLIELTDEGKEAAADFLENLESGNSTYDQSWWDLNEYNFCNGYRPVEPRDIGALTDSPIIADGHIDEETTQEELDNTKVYWFPNYMVIDELRELLTNGSVLFTLAT